MSLKDQLIRHEGLELTPYTDTVGVLTVGVGRNLERPISYELAMFMLDEDIATIKNDVKQFDWFEGLNEARQSVILNMIFNLGITRFKKFKNTINAIKAKDYLTASQEMLNSKWSEQVGHRAIELAMTMESGEYQNV